MSKKQLVSGLCLWSFTFSAILPTHAEGVLSGFWGATTRSRADGRAPSPSQSDVNAVTALTTSDPATQKASNWNIFGRVVGTGFVDPTEPEADSIYYPIYSRSSTWSEPLGYIPSSVLRDASQANSLRYNELVERLTLNDQENDSKLTPEQRKKRNEDHKHKVAMTFGVVDEEIARVLNRLSSDPLNAESSRLSIQSLQLLLDLYSHRSLKGDTLAHQAYLRIHKFVSYVINKLDSYDENSIGNELEMRALFDLLVNDMDPYQNTIRHLYIELGEKIFSQVRFKKFHSKAIAILMKAIAPGTTRNASHQLQALRVFQDNMKSGQINYDHFSYIVSQIAKMAPENESVKIQIMRFMSFIAEFENSMSEEDKELYSIVIPPFFESELNQTERMAMEDLKKKIYSSRTLQEERAGMNELETLILGFGGRRGDRASQRAYQAFKTYAEFKPQNLDLQKRKYLFLARMIRLGDKTLIRSAQSFLLRDSLNQFQVTSSTRSQFLFEFMAEATGENWPYRDQKDLRSEDLFNESMEAGLHVIGSLIPNQDEVAVERARLLAEALNSSSAKVQKLATLHLNTLWTGQLQKLVELKNQLGPRRAEEFLRASKKSLIVLNQYILNLKLILKKMSDEKIQKMELSDLIEILENPEYVSLLDMERVRKLLAQINRIEKHQDQVVDIVASYVKQRLMDCGAILSL